MGIEVIITTVATCDIPGCNEINSINGEFPSRAPKGWMENVANVKLVCPTHAKAVMTILRGKKVRGKDKKPRRTALQRQGKASEVQSKETLTDPYDADIKEAHDPLADAAKKLDDEIMNPKPKKARKGKIEEFTPEETAARIRKSQGQYCVGCKEEKTCILTGTKSLDCWMQKTKEWTEKNKVVKA